MVNTDSLTRDYYLLLDVSTSMTNEDNVGVSRLDRVKEITIAIADAVSQLDPDGINLITFGSKVTDHGNVTPANVSEVVTNIKAWGTTNMDGAIKTALANFMPEVPRTVIVITDGQPDNKKAVAEVIIEASRKIKKDEDLAIGFFQIGDDPNATSFLQFLDDELQGLGAQFDIVDTTPATSIGSPEELEQALLKFIND
ncbi:MAG: VWA domain-containing protein [Cyanophyceae cyanobacterium]